MSLLKGAIAGRAARNSHSHVVDALGRAIVEGEYRVGDALPGDAVLVERFNVSRTVLREAMKTLAAKGLVYARARVGTRVTDRKLWNLFDADVLGWHLAKGADREFIGHLSDMRLAVEPFAAQLAARLASPAEVARMFAAAEEMRTARAAEAYALADLEFHIAVVDASRNPFMYSLTSLIETALLAIFELSSPPVHAERREATAQSHRRIAEAIEAGDAEAAAAAMRVVILDGRDHIWARAGES